MNTLRLTTLEYDTECIMRTMDIIDRHSDVWNAIQQFPLLTAHAATIVFATSPTQMNTYMELCTLVTKPSMPIQAQWNLLLSDVIDNSKTFVFWQRVGMYDRGPHIFRHLLLLSLFLNYPWTTHKYTNAYVNDQCGGEPGVDGVSILIPPWLATPWHKGRVSTTLCYFV